MSLSNQARTIPRLHLIGTLVVVVVLTLALGSFFSWQYIEAHRASISRLEQVVTRQVEARLDAEMASALAYLEFTRSRTEDTLRRAVVEPVDAAMQIVEAIHARESGQRPDAEIQRLIIEALRPVRFFDGRGYYFIDDMSGRFVLLPTAPQFEGQLLPDNRDDTGHYIMRGLIEAARKPRGEGFSRYRWYRPDDPSRMADKLAYVRYFPPYDWLIGTGDYTYEWEARLQQEAIARLRSIRFGESGYIGMIDAEGRSLLSPSAPELEGKHYSELPPAQAAALKTLFSKAREGGGLVRYQWPNPATGQLATKLARVETAQPWGWVLVAAVFEDELHGALADERQSYEAASGPRVHGLLLAMGLALSIALLGSWLFSRWSGRLFKRYHDENQAQRLALQVQAESLRESEDKLATILDSVEAYIYIKDRDYRYLYANRRVCELFGRELEGVVGKSDEDFFDMQTAANLRKNDTPVIEQGERVALEEVNTTLDGKVERAFLSIKLPLRREDGTVYALCGISTDITQRKAMEEEIRHLAFYDPLTDLPNRRLLIDRLQQMIAQGARTAQHGALLFIDLDNFKTLNDTLGHDQGDALLVQVAHRLRACVREEDTVARIGGDEFVVMLGSLGLQAAEAASRARAVGEKILDGLGQPYGLQGRAHFSTPSIGVTVFAGRGLRVDELLKQADLAMYEAKAAGRNTLCFFDPEMQAALTARSMLESDLRLGLSLGQFMLHYQAQVDEGGALVGAEVLLRWQHPVRGLVSPLDFIPLAEETGLILPLGAWVLDEACAQLGRWRADARTSALTLSVNVSARQFHQPGFVDLVIAALERHGVDGGLLKLELTESLLLDDVDDTIAKMSALKARGVGFSLDDFGTGYSSLAYLKRLPLDQLKIDRSFVRDLLTDPNDAEIARAIITMADSLGLSVIAEGVETEAQRVCLANQGCHAYQGYLFGRPGPVELLWEQLVPKA